MKIGVLGGGQLGRMMALAGVPLGLEFCFLDPSSHAPAARLGEHICADYNDVAALQLFAKDLDAVTYEFENVPAETAQFLEERAPLHPPQSALQTAQDRIVEKTFLKELGVPTPPFRAASTREELDSAIEEIGAPAVLKTRRFGYDGKGQFVLRDARDAEKAWRELGGVPLILEGFVEFSRELSLICVRAQNGETAFYPLVENEHENGILRESIAPAPNSEELQILAEKHAARVLAALNYVGVLTIEFFQCGDELIANEMAPRVHNSGHWTIEGAACSQFENHLRAVCGLPLGATKTRGACAMLNILGELPDTSRVLAIPGAHLHLYDKAPQPGRKIGHITVCEEDENALHAKLKTLRALL
jgi:5-(carboxyamino)imidazole ribonucleotide synthase